ncbi:MAG TPA: hypothetical protein VN031_01355 [Candidatus Microsaccharimonas sp.]|nr:hypothetical protein [Candidatus Microsaccharimonas sp.]
MNSYTKGILERVALVIAIGLFLWGWKWTSIGVGPGHLMQDDGYNVTGGFLMFAAGLIIGRYLVVRMGANQKTTKKK